MQLDQIDLNLLKALEVLLEERQVSRAAARFHLSQSAMSRTLARLRATFGDELLVRTASGYELTPRARAVQNELLVLMPRLRSLVAGDVFDSVTATGTVRIAASDYLLTTLGERFFPAFFGQAPQMMLVIEPVVPSTFEDLDRGRLDIALTPVPPPPPLCREVLFVEDHVCLMSHDHPVTGDRLTLEDLSAFPRLGVTATRMLIDSQFDQLGVRPPGGLTVPYFTVAATALPGTRLIAVIPRRIALRFAGPRLRIAEAPAEFEPFGYPMLWHPRLTGDPAHRWVRSLLVQAAAASPSGEKETES